MVKFEAPQFGIAGRAWGSERRVDFCKGTYSLKVDGEERGTQGEYLADGGLVVWMGNEDRELVTGPSEGRRRYLDFMASQIVPGYRRSLSRYRKALQERNALLRDGRGGGREMESFTALLSRTRARGHRGAGSDDCEFGKTGDLGPRRGGGRRGAGGSAIQGRIGR